MGLQGLRDGQHLPTGGGPSPGGLLGGAAVLRGGALPRLTRISVLLCMACSLVWPSPRLCMAVCALQIMSHLQSSDCRHAAQPPAQYSHHCQLMNETELPRCLHADLVEGAGHRVAVWVALYYLLGLAPLVAALVVAARIGAALDMLLTIPASTIQGIPAAFNSVSHCQA